MSTRVIKSATYDELTIFELIENVSSNTTLTLADSNKTYILDASTGKTITLPELVAGLKFTFIVGKAFATSNWEIVSNEGGNISGLILDLGTTPASVIATDADKIVLDKAKETIGDSIEFICDIVNERWIVRGSCAVNGGITAV